ncbi:MAG TPA: YncE family protein [Ktedonobacteraceae bacterium]|nr:YncE family protein [Ktedonobacteraceae bacterium]
MKCHRLTLVLLLLSFLLLSMSMGPMTVHADGFPIIAVLPDEGQSPEAIAVDIVTHMVYIAYENPSLIVGFDPVSGTVRWHAGIGDFASDVQVDSSTHRVYVASNNFHSQSDPAERSATVLAVLDGKTGKELYATSIPITTSGLADNNITIDAKRQQVYMAGDQHGLVYVFNFSTAANGTISSTRSTLSVGPHPGAVSVNSRMGRLYVADSTAHKITVIDEDSGQQVATIQVCNDPVPPMRVDEATGRVYVVCSAGQALDVINGNTNKVIASVSVTPYPEGVAFNTATGRIYVADEGNRDSGNSDDNDGTTITVIDGQTFQVLGTLSVGRGPDGIEADPQLRRIYVATESSNAMVEVSDSVDLPLQTNTPQIQAGAIHQAIHFLQQATVATLILMLLTMVCAAINVLAPRWHSKEL